MSVCDYCGAEEGIHHVDGWCPKGGVEAPLDRKQEWLDTKFDDCGQLIAELRMEIAELKERLDRYEPKSM